MPRPSLTTDPSLHLPHEPSSRGGLHLGQALGVLLRSWLWILLPALLVAILAIVAVQVVAPRYTAEAKLILENREPAFARGAAERSDQKEQIDEQAVASQVQVVMSRDLAREAIRRLHLAGNPEFDPVGASPGLLTRLKMMFGFGKSAMERAPEDRMLDAYFERLLVFSAGKSRILSVEFKAGDPELAAKAANTIAELYIASLEAAKVDTARYASTWLGGNIEALRARVAEAEAKVETFRASNNLIGSGGAASQPLGAQQLSELSSQLSQARTIKADLTARVKMLKEMIRDGRIFEIPDVANNDLIRRTVESRMTLRAQLALESRTLLPAHPRIKELTAQLNDIESQIKSTAERVARTMENDAKIAGARVESLQAAVDGQRDVVAQGNTSEVQLRALEREAKAQREQLESYLARYREAAARDAESATPADARIISRAVVPETPSFPKKLPIVAFATVLALLLSAGAVIGRHLLMSPVSGEQPIYDAPSDQEFEPAKSVSERFNYPEPLPPGSDRQEDDIQERPIQQRPVAATFTPIVQDGRHTEHDDAVPMQTASSVMMLPVLYSAGMVDHAAADATRHDEPTRDAAPEAKPDGNPLARPLEQEEPALRKGFDDHSLAARPDQETKPADQSRNTYDLHPLITRLESTPVQGGRCVLVADTMWRNDGTLGHDLAASLGRSLSDGRRVLTIDVNGRGEPKAGSATDPGFSDLVAGEAAFLDVIHPVAGSTLHTIRRGFIEVEVILEEPQGLAISLNAMAQAYDWVVLRLDVTQTETGTSLLSALSTCVSAVVIVSNAEPDNADLIALYRLAEEAGTDQVLVARDQATSDSDAGPEADLSLKLSA